MYSKSDIVVAVVIIVIAALIIWFRVDAIMEYPSSGSPGSQIASKTSELSDPDAVASPVTDGAVDEPSEEAAASEAAVEPPPEPPVEETPPPPTETTFEVKSGEATSTIANNLANANLVPSASDFLNAVKSAGAETRLKAGTFKIPGGSSVDQIVQILTR
jgi:cell division protein YceG involved in septum cleavage